MSTILNNLKTQWKQPSLLRAPQDSEGWVHLVCADCCVVSVLAHQVGCRWKWRLSLGSLLFLFLQRFSVYQASWCPRAGHHPLPKTCLSVPGVPEALPPSPALTHIRTWLESCSLDAWLGGWAKSEPLGIAMDLGDRGLLRVTSPSKSFFFWKKFHFYTGLLEIRGPGEGKAPARISGWERQGTWTFGGPGLSHPLPPGRGSVKPVNRLGPQIHLPIVIVFLCLWVSGIS